MTAQFDLTEDQSAIQDMARRFTAALEASFGGGAVTAPLADLAFQSADGFGQGGGSGRGRPGGTLGGGARR